MVLCAGKEGCFTDNRALMDRFECDGLRVRLIVFADC